MSTDLVKVDAPDPQALMRRSSDVAGVCRAIVVQTAMKISGRKYVRVEGWEAIATAHGCIASAQDVQRVEPPDSGYRAEAVLRRIDTGQVIATAEGFVGDDEKTWASRPVYARRAMAQTRAISRVCRTAFAHVVVLMDAGLSTTPAEEVPSEGFDAEEAEVIPARADPDEGPSGAAPDADEPVMGFGSCKGQTAAQLDARSLEWYRAAYGRDVADPAKRKWAKRNTVILNSLDAEALRRADGGFPKTPEQASVPF